MNREQFDHVLHAAADAAGCDEIVVIGSQAILGVVEQPPEAMLVSMEADVYPAGLPERGDRIDGALGDGSMFHRSFGYYAHAVGERTASLPAGWEARARRVSIPRRAAGKRDVIAICPTPEDLLLSKLAAGRDRDLSYVRTALDAGLADVGVIRARIDDLPVDRERRSRLAATLRALT